jgi:cadmium resistance protein CadD (predicted permease)
MIPSIAIVRVQNPGSRRIGIWLPLFLLWIPAILVAPLILFVLLVVCVAMRISFLQSVAVFWGILCSLPGTHVHVRAEGTQVLVRIL